MILHRLSVENLAGIGRANLSLSPTGVHLIEGPNESGKSTLMTALRLVLFEQDSTAKQSVRALQPAGRDVAAVVEVEMETKAGRFVYRKQFFKKPRTELEILYPGQAQLSGREAHERVLAMLGECVDLDLWRALWVDQGKALEHLQLATLPTLLQSLGGDAGADDAVTQGVQAEYLRYFTEKRGQATRLLSDARAEVADTTEQVAALKQRHDELETAVLRRDAVTRELVALGSQRERAEADLREKGAAWQAALAAKDAVDKADQAIRGARAELTLAQKEQQERLQQQQILDQVTEEHAQLVEDLPGLAKPADAAEQAWRTAHAALAEARRLRDDSGEPAVPGSVSLPTAEILAQVRERLGDVGDEANGDDAVVQGQAAMAALPVTAAALRELEALHTRVEHARIAVEAQAPRVTVENLGESDARVTVDGVERPAPTGESSEHMVANDLHIELPGRLRVWVQAPGNAAERARALHHAEDILSQGCRKWGVESVEQARWVAEERSTLATLVERVARQRVNAAEHTEQESRTAWEDARIISTEAKRRLAETAARAEAANAVLNRAVASLDDNLLATKLKIAQKKLVDLEEGSYASLHELGDRDPHRLGDEAGAAETERNRLERDIQSFELEQERLGAQLRLQGEEGLFEQLQRAGVRLAKAQHTLTSMERRARAAKLLRTVVEEERRNTHARYADPLRETIENLGRSVFGDGFSVTLGEELQISRRTLDGITLPVSALSVGAQEQLAVITRLAAAELVARDEPVPVFLDDIFGYSDPERLRALAGLLSRAGEQGQLLLLTSYPERYRHVRDLVRLSVLNPVTA